MQNGFTDLNELFESMKNSDPRTLNDDGQWSTDLPTFGGGEPADTVGVWSWDNDRLLVGSCSDDLEIVTRDEWTD